MPERSSYPDGAPCWADLTAPDLESSRSFYGAVMGWDFQDTGADYNHYTMCLWQGQPVAALMPPPPGAEALPPVWNVYLATGDADAAVKTIDQAGGKVVMGPHEVPGAGRLVFAFDPDCKGANDIQALIDEVMSKLLASQPQPVSHRKN